jgi:CcmD family protein
MMKTNMIKKLFALITLTGLSILPTIAQEKIAMADGLRAEGKIYVVVAIISVIFIGIVIYLISLDKKITKVEEQLKEKKN